MYVHVLRVGKPGPRGLNGSDGGPGAKGPPGDDGKSLMWDSYPFSKQANNK